MIADCDHICVGPGAWGRGATPAEALRVARRYRVSWLRGGWTVYRIDRRVEFHDGHFFWDDGVPAPEVVDRRDSRMHRLPLPENRTLQSA